jgi:PKD repeat protein
MRSYCRFGLPALLLAFVLSCSNSGPSGPIGPTPVIVSTSPSTSQITIARGASVVFEIEAQGPNGEPVQIQFRVNQLVAASSSSYVFTANDTGRYRIEAVASIGENTTTHTWTVDVTVPANLPPTADLTTSAVEGEAPFTVTAQVTAQDVDGAVSSVSIDFNNDGLPEQTAAGGTLTANHTYTTVGNYTIRVTAVDDGGLSTIVNRAVTVLQPNLAPTGSLTSDSVSGDAPVTTILRASGSDVDGTVVRWEINTGIDDTWVDIPVSGFREVQYPYSDAPYRPRLRLTDDKGAVSVIDGPAITVFLPISQNLSSSGFTSGNPWFNNFPSFAPAIFADGNDRMRFAVVVRDHNGLPIADTPVRITSLRPELVSALGDRLGETVTIQIDGNGSTNAAGILTGSITSRTSGHVMTLLGLGTFAFDLKVEAYAGHDTWKTLPQLTRTNIETTVSSQEGVGQVQVFPAAACPNVEREIRIRGFGNSVSPSPGVPVPGVYADVRYTGRRLIEGLRPGPGYDNWRTGSDGWITLKVRPTEAGSWIIVAYVDGIALNIPSGLYVEQC